jgi:hypothetical protein
MRILLIGARGRGEETSERRGRMRIEESRTVFVMGRRGQVAGKRRRSFGLLKRMTLGWKTDVEERH